MSEHLMKCGAEGCGEWCHPILVDGSPRCPKHLPTSVQAPSKSSAASSPDEFVLGQSGVMTRREYDEISKTDPEGRIP